MLDRINVKILLVFSLMSYIHMHRGTVGVIKATTTQLGIRLAFTVNFHIAYHGGVQIVY